MASITPAQQLVIETIKAEGSINADDVHHAVERSLTGLGWIDEVNGDFILTEDYYDANPESSMPTTPADAPTVDLPDDVPEPPAEEYELEDGQIVIEIGFPTTIQVGVSPDGTTAEMARLAKGYRAPVISFEEIRTNKGRTIYYNCLHVETGTEFYLSCNPDSTDPRAHTMMQVAKSAE